MVVKEAKQESDLQLDHEIAKKVAHMFCNKKVITLDPSGRILIELLEEAGYLRERSNGFSGPCTDKAGPRK